MQLTLERVRFSGDPEADARVRGHAGELRVSASWVYRAFVRWCLHFLSTGRMPEDAYRLQGLIGGQSVPLVTVSPTTPLPSSPGSSARPATVAPWTL